MSAHEIERKINKLPSHLIPQINDFIDFLLSKYEEKAVEQGNFQFDWEGGLADLKDEFTSVELEHKAMEWR